MKKQNNYYVETREIDVKRMLVHTLTYWRWILIIALLGAVILGASQYKKDVTAAKNNIQAQIDAANTPVPTISSLSAQLSSDEVQNVESAVNYKAKANERNTYLNQSVYMHLDAYNEQVVYLNYAVGGDNSGNMIEKLSNYISSEELVSAIQSELSLSIENKYLMELYGISYTDNRSEVTVKVCADSAEESATIADCLDKYLQSYIQNTFGQEETAQFVLKDRTSDVIIDDNLLSLQSTYYAEVYNNMNTYNSLYGGFNDVQKQLFDMMMDKRENGSSSIYDAAGEEEEVVLSGDASAIDTTIHVRLSIKMILAGFFAGAIIAYAVFALFYTISKAVHGEDEIKYLFAVPVFGTVRTAAFEKKKAGAAIDTAVDKLYSGNKKYLDTNKQMQMVYSNILLSCKKNGVSSLYLTGSEIDRVPENCITELVNKLKEKQIYVTAGNSILYDAEALMDMAACGHTVFMETEEKSKCEEIAKELNLCIQNEIKVLGVIMTRK